MNSSRHLGFIALTAMALAAAGVGCTTTMPLPPELQDAQVIATTGRSRAIILGKLKISMKPPFVLQDLKTGSATKAFWHWPPISEMGVDFEWQNVVGGFSFRLEKEGTEPATLGNVACVWGLATTSGGFSVAEFGLEFKVPSGSSLMCEFFPAPGVEPWRLLLWTGKPSNWVVPNFPSGGVLFRQDARYGATSTNVIEPPGIHAQYMTGTVFTRDGRPVAAIERLVPGRVLVQASLPPEDRTLLVAMGAAIFVYDALTLPFSHP